MCYQWDFQLRGAVLHVFTINMSYTRALIHSPHYWKKTATNVNRNRGQQSFPNFESSYKVHCLVCVVSISHRSTVGIWSLWQIDCLKQLLIVASTEKGFLDGPHKSLSFRSLRPVCRTQTQRNKCNWGRKTASNFALSSVVNIHCGTEDGIE